jgi:hypothetical protein
VHTMKTRRLLHAAAALVAGAVIAVGVASTADAASPPASPLPTAATAPGAAPSTIDKGRLGAIVIHKFRQPQAGPAAAHGNGLEAPSDALVPIAGAGFVVQQLDPAGFDLTTNDGWAALSELSPEKAAPMKKGYGVGVTTDAHGVATAPDLPLGVYLVSEVKSPKGVTPSDPFLVTVPITDPESLSSWLYTVNVYPKSVVVDQVTPSATPSHRPSAAADHTSSTPAPWNPGAAVHTGGDAVVGWVGHYWAQLCAVVAVVAGATAAVGVYGRRRRPRRGR